MWNSLFQTDYYEISDVSFEQQEILLEYFELKNVGVAEINTLLAVTAPQTSDSRLGVVFTTDDFFEDMIKQRRANALIINYTIVSPYPYSFTTEKSFLCEMEIHLDDFTRLYKLIQKDMKGDYLIVRSPAPSEFIYSVVQSDKK